MLAITHRLAWPFFTENCPIYLIQLKPIFHRDAKKVALGPRVPLAPHRHYFALGIPTCWYLKMLKFAFPPTQNIKFAFSPDAKPLCVGHVHFIFFVLISFALGSRHKSNFQWNMGLSLQKDPSPPLLYSTSQKETAVPPPPPLPSLPWLHT